jgi:hypothetical protein
MNCEKCQELLSDFLGGTIGADDHALFKTHLDDCLCCGDVREELQAIVSVARESREQFVAPPNERAMWLRIRNTIESENGLRSRAATANHSSARENFWSRLVNKRWELSLPQMTTAVAAIVVTVSLVTTLGLQSMMSRQAIAEQQQEDTIVGAGRNNLRVDGRYPRAYLEPHQASISYWQQRVEQRKASWNPRLRVSFDRSLTVLDQAVNDSLDELQRNPHDEVSEEMLNSALRDKIELLREFGEQ